MIDLHGGKYTLNNSTKTRRRELINIRINIKKKINSPCSYWPLKFPSLVMGGQSPVLVLSKNMFKSLCPKPTCTSTVRSYVLVSSCLCVFWFHHQLLQTVSKCPWASHRSPDCSWCEWMSEYDIHYKKVLSNRQMRKVLYINTVRLPCVDVASDVTWKNHIVVKIGLMTQMTNGRHKPQL